MKNMKEKINNYEVLDKNQKNINEKLLEYIMVRKYNENKIQEIIKEDIREMIWMDDIDEN